MGDSQVVKLLPEPEEGTYVELLQVLPNHGPIMDMVRLNQAGKTQLITCSGSGANGSLRTVEFGVGMEVQAEVHLPGIKSMFPVYVNDVAVYLVCAFAQETRVLEMTSEKELVEVDKQGGFMYDKRTLCVHQTQDVFVQVCDSSINVCPVDALARDNTPVTKTQACAGLTAACASDAFVVVASGTSVQVFSNPGLEVVLQVDMEAEVACVGVHPELGFVAVGLWGLNVVRVLSLPLGELVSEHVVEALPRSVLLGHVASNKLLVGLGQGTLVNVDLEEATMKGVNKTKAYSLGNKAVSLVPSKQGVFACSDRPSFLHARNGQCKLMVGTVCTYFALALSPLSLYYQPHFTHILDLTPFTLVLISTVNSTQPASHMCPFPLQVSSGCVALSSSDTLILGEVAALQRQHLHVRSFPTMDTPSHICHLTQSSTLVVSTMLYPNNMNANAQKQGVEIESEDVQEEEEATGDGWRGGGRRGRRSRRRDRTSPTTSPPPIPGEPRLCACAGAILVRRVGLVCIGRFRGGECFGECGDERPAGVHLGRHHLRGRRCSGGGEGPLVDLVL